jgi:UDP-N-acetylmuramate--alanine ligase
MKTKKIFFIGIGGKGLNGIADICLKKGYDVYGVDTKNSPEIEKLQKNGATIFNNHSASNISKDIDLIIRTSIVESCPEIERARKLKIPILKRSAFLKKITENDFKISIAGSHGKSTTTALLGLSLLNNDLSPNIYGGAYIKEIDDYNYLGKNNLSVIEACEYDRSFYDLIGNATIITRAEKSHLEYYKDEDEMLDAFRTFINMHSSTSKIFINGDDINLIKVSDTARAKIITFGLGELNDYQIINLNLKKDYTEFGLIKNDKQNKTIVKDFKILIPGIYNVLNFTAVLAYFDQMNYDLSGVHKTALNFTGVGRRFEINYTEEGVVLVDDFAHHPTQVKNLISSLKQFFPEKKICAVFQPRQYHLIKSFLREYGSSFEHSDEVVITDLVPALGDKPEDLKSLCKNDVMNAVKLYSQKPVISKNNFSEIANYVKEKFGNDAVLAMIGAGDVYKIKEFFKIKKV